MSVGEHLVVDVDRETGRGYEADVAYYSTWMGIICRVVW
jgi:hypothetical protein